MKMRGLLGILLKDQRTRIADYETLEMLQKEGIKSRTQFNEKCRLIRLIKLFQDCLA